MLVGIADWLFFDHPIGWTAGGYLLLVAGSIILLRFHELPPRAAAGLTAWIAALGAGMTVDFWWLPLLLMFLGLFMLSCISRGGWTTSILEWLRRGIIFGFRAPWKLPLDLFFSQETHPGIRIRPMGCFVHIGIPLALSMVFICLLSTANPVLSMWIDKANESVQLVRILFWVILAMALWPMLNPPELGPCHVPATGRESWIGRRIPTSLTLRCLWLFNLIFAIQTVTDICYLWGGVELPTGMTFAQYAHRGAYPLMVTALLSATLVLAAFSPGAEALNLARARRLVYLWLAQNVFLMANSILRLAAYIEVYSLTRWRIAALIWMGVVGAGLLWILLRIVFHRSNGWLISANLATALAVLTASCFVDFNGVIANFNVLHCREIDRQGAPLDINYLRNLGPQAIPALKWLHTRLPEHEAGLEAGVCVKELQENLLQSTTDWRGWTWRKAALLRELKDGK